MTVLGSVLKTDTRWLTGEHSMNMYEQQRIYIQPPSWIRYSGVPPSCIEVSVSFNGDN